MSVLDQLAQSCFRSQITASVRAEPAVALQLSQGWKWEQTIAKLWIETRQFCALLVSHFILLQTLHQKSLMQHPLL